MSAPAPLLEQRSTAGDTELCHVVCNVYEDKTFCGITSVTEDWCPDENCEKECVVCTDLERTLTRCPVCGMQCGLAFT